MLENTYLNNPNFFVISTENCEGIKTKLYGFAISDNKVYINGCIGDIPLNSDGTYINVVKENEYITIQQDYNGGYGLYFFQNGDFFAVSNSFILLANYLRDRAYITLNTDFAKYFITEGLSSVSVSETLINEITLLPKNLKISINITLKEVSFFEPNYDTKKVNLDSKEGIEILDNWYEKWQSLLISLQKDDEEITVDLTGGMDSRATFSIFNSELVNLDRLKVHSSKGQLHTHKEDFEIASLIANKFNFKLNKPFNSVKISQSNSTAFYNSILVKLGIHKRMYYKSSYNLKRLFYFTGFGGESIRSNWKDPESFIKNKMNKNNFLTIDCKESINRIVLDSIQEVREKYSCRNNDDLMNNYYRDSWSRSHFGKNTVESFLENSICLNPLMDKELYKIYSGDDTLLSLIYERYLNELSGIKFDSNKILNSSSIEKAKEINLRYPYVRKNEYTDGFSIIDSTKFSSDIIKSNISHDPEVHIIEMLRSKKVEDTIVSFLGQEVYQKAMKEWASESFVKDRLACALVAIAITKSFVENNSIDINDKSNIHSVSVLKLLETFKLARIDIKNIGSSDNNIIFDRKNYDFSLSSPKWFRKKNDGIGYVVESSKLSLNLRFTCVNDGEVRVSLRGTDIRNERNERLQAWIDFVSCKVDGIENITNKASVWHDKPVHIVFPVKNNQVITLKIKWLPYAYKDTEFVTAIIELLASKSINFAKN